MLFQFNTSVDAIAFSIIAAASLFHADKTCNTNKKISLHLIYIACIIVIVLLQSRVAILGLATATTLVFLPQYPRLQKRVFFIPVLVAIAGLTAGLAYFTKQPSTQSRLFIYKISWQLWKQHWLFGTGSGKFNLAFNHAQASWFQNHSLFSTEAFLANDGYFAFNEWLHYAIEYGLAGSAAAIIISCLLAKKYYRYIKNNSAQTNAFWLILLAPIITASLFSYPLHRWYFQCIFVFGSTALIIPEIKIAARFCRHLKPVLFTAIASYYLLRCGIQIYVQQQFTAIKIIWAEGYKTEAINQLQVLEKKFPNNYHLSQTLAVWLYATGRQTQAIAVLEHRHQFECNQQHHALLGQWYTARHDSGNAASHLLTSLYLTPHLLQTRFLLMNFYLQEKDLPKAVYWAKQLLHYPPKIKNPDANLFKDSAIRLLSVYQ